MPASDSALQCGEMRWKLMKRYIFWKVGSWENTSFCMVFQGQKECASVEDDKQNRWKCEL